MQSSIEDMVNRATSEVLDGIVDWGLNLEICDVVARNAAELAPRLVVSVEMRLKSKDTKVQGLAVTLIETCVKNGSAEVHGAVGTKAFLNVLTSVAQNSSSGETRDKALALIEQWGLAFEGKRDVYPAYVETYASLKVRGVAFPEGTQEAAPPVFTPAATVQDQTDQETVSGAQDAALAKLEADLNVVADKISLCNEMLPNSPGLENDDALAEVIGFLEACRPRMLTLIDAASRGALSDDLLATALKVNDALAKALDDEIQSSTKSMNSSSSPQPLSADIFSQGNTPLQPTPPTSTPLPHLPLDDEPPDDALQTGARQSRTNNQPATSQPPDLLDFGAGIPPPSSSPQQQQQQQQQQPNQPDLL